MAKYEVKTMQKDIEKLKEKMNSSNSGIIEPLSDKKTLELSDKKISKKPDSQKILFQQKSQKSSHLLKVKIFFILIILALIISFGLYYWQNYFE